MRCSAPYLARRSLAIAAETGASSSTVMIAGLATRPAYERDPAFGRESRWFTRAG